MRLIFIFTIFLAIVLSTNATNIQVSGEVSGTWDVDTVLVMDNLLVSNDFVFTTFIVDNQKIINWNGTDDHGNRLPAGVYLYQLRNQQSVTTRKMVIGQ